MAKKTIFLYTRIFTLKEINKAPSSSLLCVSERVYIYSLEVQETKQQRRRMEEETEKLVAISVSPQRKRDTKLELTVDEVVEQYVGSLGFSQIIHVFLVSLAWIFDSQNTLVTIFTDAQPAAWRCTSPPCVHDDTANAAAVCSMVAGSWEWIGGSKSSIIAEWSLVCDRKLLAAAPASLFFIGSLLGKFTNTYFFCICSVGYQVTYFPFIPQLRFIRFAFFFFFFFFN